MILLANENNSKPVSTSDFLPTFVDNTNYLQTNDNINSSKDLPFSRLLKPYRKSFINDPSNPIGSLKANEIIHGFDRDIRYKRSDWSDIKSIGETLTGKVHLVCYPRWFFKLAIFIRWATCYYCNMWALLFLLWTMKRAGARNDFIKPETQNKRTRSLLTTIDFIVKPVLCRSTFFIPWTGSNGVQAQVFLFLMISISKWIKSHVYLYYDVELDYKLRENTYLTNNRTNITPIEPNPIEPMDDDFWYNEDFTRYDPKKITDNSYTLHHPPNVLAFEDTFQSRDFIQGQSEIKNRELIHHSNFLFNTYQNSFDRSDTSIVQDPSLISRLVVDANSKLSLRDMNYYRNVRDIDILENTPRFPRKEGMEEVNGLILSMRNHVSNIQDLHVKLAKRILLMKDSHLASNVIRPDDGSVSSLSNLTAYDFNPGPTNNLFKSIISSENPPLQLVKLVLSYGHGLVTTSNWITWLPWTIATGRIQYLLMSEMTALRSKLEKSSNILYEVTDSSLPRNQGENIRRAIRSIDNLGVIFNKSLEIYDKLLPDLPAAHREIINGEEHLFSRLEPIELDLPTPFVSDSTLYQYVDNRAVFEYMQMYTTISRSEIAWMNLLKKFPFLPYIREFNEFELAEYMYRCSTSFIKAPDLTSWRSQNPSLLKKAAMAGKTVIPMEASWGNVDFGKICLGIDANTYKTLVQPYLVNNYEITYLMYHFPEFNEKIIYG
jgi:hypothetical protein